MLLCEECMLWFFIISHIRVFLSVIVYDVKVYITSKI